MIAFAMLSPLARAMFALWALLLCLTNIGSAVLATVKKRYRFSAVALLLFAPVYGMWQIIFDYSLFGGTSEQTAITGTACALAWGYWLAAFIILTLAAGLLLGYNIRYDKTFITPGTIKLFLDKMPCGICCWRENGRVLFSNVCMNELCMEITRQPLLNGIQFHDAVHDDIVATGNKVWRFSSREFESNGERLFEMIASDITGEYARTRALEKDKVELSRLNDALWEYNLGIDESVHQQEILQAKMNIHDEMNRLMLSTVAVDKEDTETLDRIFSLWEQNALLLCMEADKKSGRQETDAIDSLANALGLRTVWSGEVPTAFSQSQRSLFFATAQEAVVNAVKHAKAQTLEISIARTKTQWCCRFTNDGEMPTGTVNSVGGLANIDLLAKEQGAEISVEVGEKFSLVLCLNQPIG